MRTRVLNMVARAVVDTIDDEKKIQLLQLKLLSGELRGEVERVQNYGFTSHPKAGAEAAVVFVGGSRDHGLVIAVDDRRYRLKNLESGEVAVYDHTGSTLVMKANGDIEVAPSSGLTTLTGDLEVDGAISAGGNIDSAGTVTGETDVIGGGKSLKTHTHGGSPLTLVGGPCTAGGVSGGSGQVGGNTGAPT